MLNTKLAHIRRCGRTRRHMRRSVGICRLIRNCRLRNPGRCGRKVMSAHRLPLSAALSAPTRAFLAAALSRTPRWDSAREDLATGRISGRWSWLPQKSIRPLRGDVGAVWLSFPVKHRAGPYRGVPVEESPAGRHRRAACADQSPRRPSIPVDHSAASNPIRWPTRQIPRRLARLPQGYQPHSRASEGCRCRLAELLKRLSGQSHRIYAVRSGVLTGRPTAWIIDHACRRPAPSAFSSAGTAGCGDSDYFAAASMDKLPPVGFLGTLAGASVGYFSDASDKTISSTPIPPTFRAKFRRLADHRHPHLRHEPPIATPRAGTGWCRCVADVFDASGMFLLRRFRCRGSDAYRTIVRFFRSIWVG